MLIKYMGTTREFDVATYKYNNYIQYLDRWGIDTNENRQSLVDTLLTYSYDRATAGYSAATIKLHADTLARLTAEEIAAITAKGFTLTA